MTFLIQYLKWYILFWINSKQDKNFVILEGNVLKELHFLSVENFRKKWNTSRDSHLHVHLSNTHIDTP